jgi:AcrR family transcriptional regulator
MGRKPKDESASLKREDEIIQAAITVFSSKGFSASTTNEIAKEAGIAEGTIFRYFKTKKDILHGILLKMIKTFSSTIVLSGIEKIFRESEGKDLQSVFKEIILDRLNIARSIQPMAQVLLTEAIYHADIREALYENLYLKALEFYTAFHSQMVEKGVIRPDISPETVLRTAMSAMAALILQFSLNTAVLDEKKMEKEMDAVADLLLNGITKK